MIEFFKDVTWGQIIASALVALVTTLLIEYAIKPGLEARKTTYIEKKRRLSDVKASLEFLNTHLRLIIGFDRFSKNGKPIPTNRKLLQQLLDGAHNTSQLLNELLPRVMYENHYNKTDIDEAQELTARTRAAITQTSDNVNRGAYGSFRSTNKKVLSGYLENSETTLKSLENIK